jgi:hypothetical protein
MSSRKGKGCAFCLAADDKYHGVANSALSHRETDKGPGGGDGLAANVFSETLPAGQ